MDYTETTLTAERLSLLEGEEKGDVLAWLTAPNIGHIGKDWDNE